MAAVINASIAARVAAPKVRLDSAWTDRASVARAFPGRTTRTSHPAREPANIQTARAQNVSDPVLRASPPSTARRRPPHLLRQGRRRHRPRAVRLTPDRSRARGPFPATVRDVICCGSRSVERGALGGPNARPREGRPSGAPVRSAPCGRVAPRPRHARGDGTSDARAPLPRRSAPRGPSIAPRRGSNVATVKRASRMIAASASDRVVVPNDHSPTYPQPIYLSRNPTARPRRRLSPCARRRMSRRR